VVLSDIQHKINIGDYTFSDHAVKRMIQRNILRHEVEEAICHGEIIEEYPNDTYAPSCLIYGKTKVGRNLHIQVSSPPVVVTVTVYEPDPKDWMDFRTRR